ncbi:hypothetical protein QYE76_014664 [Lolium multiflorum]|uniref:CRAL-TRIO domain-containing protein n=1 Tax=Lolium multiflorum TaxID=4521 RepID=A0AAD8X8D9_LOLMU|nr:hypothetical protein QYE76_014664 [Lolium multiflorum]
MADETKQETAAAAEVVVTEAEKKVEVEEKAVEVEVKAVEVVEEKVDEAATAAAAEEEAEAEAGADDAAVIEGSTASFKEESNLVSDLADPEQKALAQLKDLVAAALAAGEFDLPPPPPPTPAAEEPKAEEPAKPDAAAPEKTEVAAESEPKAEASAPEEPKADAPAQEEPKVEEPAKEEPKADAPAVAAAAAEEPKAEVPAEEAKPADPEPEEKTVVVTAEETVVSTAEETVVPVATSAETAVPASTEPAAPAAAEPKPEELIWGVPLAGGDERTDTVFLKFLRAREFKVKEAMSMLKAAILWRKSFGIDALLGADLGVPELESVVFYRGADREGHPVCYNVYSEFQDKDLYEKAFGDDDKRERFLRWRIQLLERGIREQLDFSSSGVCSMVQVTDLKNSPPMLGKHRAVTRQALSLLQDNYPEFIAKKVFINVPWWYLAANKMMSPFLTQRTKSKFTVCSPAKTAETLFRYIAPEQVPVQFGGLFKEDDTEFSTSDAVTELTVKPSSRKLLRFLLLRLILFSYFQIYTSMV